MCASPIGYKISQLNWSDMSSEYVQNAFFTRACFSEKTD